MSLISYMAEGTILMTQTVEVGEIKEIEEV